MKLIIIDTETADNENTPCEISATLYQVGEYSGAIAALAGGIASISTLIPVEVNNAQAINGIRPELTQAAHPIYQHSLELLREMSAIAVGEKTFGF